MFTGLIESVGKVESIHRMGEQTRMIISPTSPFEEIELGESIAVNGVCLTVEECSSHWFEVYASGETLRRSTLRDTRRGEIVNLERALKLGERMGGHLVLGHVDCVGRIEGIRQRGESLGYTISFPPQYSRYVIEKGSITLDGISLTINSISQGRVEVNIIPETRKRTNISTWTPGKGVNIEFDVIGKYVEKLLSPWRERDKGQGITLDFLKEHGF